MATLQCFFARLGRSSTVCELCFLPTHQPTEAECANASLFADTVRASMERSLHERYTNVRSRTPYNDVLGGGGRGLGVAWALELPGQSFEEECLRN